MIETRPPNQKTLEVDCSLECGKPVAFVVLVGSQALCFCQEHALELVAAMPLPLLEAGVSVRIRRHECPLCDSGEGPCVSGKKQLGTHHNGRRQRALVSDDWSP